MTRRTAADLSYRMTAAGLRRPLFFATVVATTLGGTEVMYDVLQANGLNALEIATLVVFFVTFGWISVAFWTGAVGFVLGMAGLDPLSLRRVTRIRQPEVPSPPPRTVLVMPVYNEEPVEVLARVEATWRSLQATGRSGGFEFFMLSDSTPEFGRAEAAGLAALAARLGATGRMFHRRRTENTGRKAGNIAEFCRRWGQRYDFMVVLDADSVMSGDTILRLVATLSANPKAGLVQTAPMPAGQQTLFARFLQFGSRLYSPMLAAGLAFWQMGEATYWGHNAIIRISAFTRCCGLHPLPGRQPFGGEILSHDFVEAGLLHRGGWQVLLIADLEGSYEEIPPTILGFAARDRRWAQGNMQHLHLVAVPGLHWVGRLQFIFGALSYMSSLLWLLLLMLGVTAALVEALVPPEYFTPGYTLFPVWPIARAGELHALFAATMAMLLMPKAWGVILCLTTRARRRAFGGGLWVVLSAIVEAVFATLLAPMMMAFHAAFVATILAGRTITWSPQVRAGMNVSYGEAWRAAGLPVTAAVMIGVVTYYLTPGFFWWILPVTGGLALAVPMITWSSRESLGRRFAAAGLFLTPEEIDAPSVLRELDLARRRPIDVAASTAADEVAPPPEWPTDMPALPLVGTRPQRLGELVTPRS